MGGLTTLKVGNGFRSSNHVLGRDFYAPLLNLSVRLQRAAAYFSSSVFSIAPVDYIEFFARGGRMQLVCSPQLSREDAVALSNAIVNRPRLRSITNLERISDAVKRGRLAWPEMLAGLVAWDCLLIRIALPISPEPSSIYHEKIGIFEDSLGNFFGFTGSANESRQAYLANFERVDIYLSFGTESERHRALQIKGHFADLWNNRTNRLRIIDLAQAIKESLLVIDTNGHENTTGASFAEIDLVPDPEVLIPSADITLMDHQKRAVNSWGDAGGRGILEMATGSGKTLTALTLASRLYDRIGPPLGIIIVCPLIHLVDQWCSIAAKFGLAPVRCAEGEERWRHELSAAIFALNSGKRNILSIATTAATMVTPAFQQLVGNIRQPLLLIADEVHNYGTVAISGSLPVNAQLRLGLSATPARWLDLPGTARLQRYFGQTIFKYTLEDALKDEVLTPYRYHPIIVGLDADEQEEYMRISSQLGRLLHSSDSNVISEPAKRLLIKRARLIGAAKNKLPRLREMLLQMRDQTHILIYCGDGQVEGEVSTETRRQVDAVIAMAGGNLGFRCARYLASTTSERRQDLLKAFDQGEVQVLVAIRCLDEGVDVPSTRTAFLLASSTNPRQFIQRRGRILRKFPGKYRAHMYDFFAIPDLDQISSNSPSFEVIRRLVANQFQRAEEFAELAENGPAACASLLEYRKKLHLLAEFPTLTEDFS